MSEPPSQTAGGCDSAIAVNRAGQIGYRLKTPGRDATTDVLLEPLRRRGLHDARSLTFPADIGSACVGPVDPQRANGGIERVVLELGQRCPRPYGHEHASRGRSCQRNVTRNARNPVCKSVHE